jgi:hypothetical protein
MLFEIGQALPPSLWRGAISACIVGALLPIAGAGWAFAAGVAVSLGAGWLAGYRLPPRSTPRVSMFAQRERKA